MHLSEPLYLKIYNTYSPPLQGLSSDTRRSHGLCMSPYILLCPLRVTLRLYLNAVGKMGKKTFITFFFFFWESNNHIYLEFQNGRTCWYYGASIFSLLLELTHYVPPCYCHTQTCTLVPSFHGEKALSGNILAGWQYFYQSECFMIFMQDGDT